MVPRTVETSWIFLLSNLFIFLVSQKNWLDNIKCKQIINRYEERIERLMRTHLKSWIVKIERKIKNKESYLYLI